ncbi:helix-turn-helix transcriptional regulator [Caldimonas tepidiphila]|uniref:helix-turn-helix transcriptional regulator n=1 Tax=Caldimonas tepidiphila TaxID=2315841 RepID=UPI00130047DB|nr:response regulator transcription factor [Caldimonas tepidiphila]
MDEASGGSGSPIERLLQAWHPGTPAGPVPEAWCAERPPPCPRASTAPPRGAPLLLCPAPGHEEAVEGLRVVWRDSVAPQPLATAAPRTIEELSRLLSEHAPQLLLIDADLCLRFGAGALRRLQRAFPATEWIIGWDEPTKCRADVVIQCHARGCIAWNAPAAEQLRALRAVQAGELWFPRAVMQALYLSLLNELPVGAGARETDAETVGPGTALSAREAEVLALTRKGLTNKEIAARLDISVNTVKKHLANAFEKCGVRSRRQLLK